MRERRGANGSAAAGRGCGIVSRRGGAGPPAGGGALLRPPVRRWRRGQRRGAERSCAGPGRWLRGGSAFPGRVPSCPLTRDSAPPPLFVPRERRLSLPQQRAVPRGGERRGAPFRTPPPGVTHHTRAGGRNLPRRVTTCRSPGARLGPAAEPGWAKGRVRARRRFPRLFLHAFLCSRRAPVPPPRLSEQPGIAPAPLSRSPEARSGLVSPAGYAQAPAPCFRSPPGERASPLRGGTLGNAPSGLPLLEWF